VTEPAALRGTLRAHRRATAVSALGGVVHQACEILVPAVVGAAVDRAIAPSDSGALLLWLGLLAALFIVLNGAYRVQYLVGRRATLWAEHDLRLALSARALAPEGLTAVEGVGTGGGALTSVANTDALRTAQAIQAVSLVTGAVAALVVAAVVLLAGVSVVLGLVVLLGAPPTAWLLHRAALPLQRRSAAEQARGAEAAHLATDLVRGLRSLRGLGMERAAARRYRRVSAASLEATVGAARAEGNLEAVNVLVGGVFLAVVAFVGARLAVEGHVSIGQLVAAVGMAQFLVGPLERLAYAGGMFARARASAARIDAVLAAAPAVRGGAARADDGGGALRVSAPIALDVAAGAHVGVVAGPAEAGALLDILARRAPAPEGATVTLDGVALGDLTLDDGARTLLVADHDAELFEGSVADNLGAASDAVLAAACADQVLDALADGAASDVGERGRRLSGGQRQRLALARALARDPVVLVLHDPTTAVDAATEARIGEGLARVRAGRTTVLLCSSPALLARCDEVVLVGDGGTVLARGTHAELVADARYREAVLG
jgi:putative ABC transport system ATP-binding protein